jgi:transposase
MPKASNSCGETTEPRSERLVALGVLFSGQTVRVRFNRSGDRQLNQALHVAVLTRLRYDPATRAYAQRRRAQARPTARSDAAWSATLPVSCSDCWSTERAAG